VHLVKTTGSNSGQKCGKVDAVLRRLTGIQIGEYQSPMAFLMLFGLWAHIFWAVKELGCPT
jgi:hypothetical protein